jgi:hypothetical protein
MENLILLQGFASAPSNSRNVAVRWTDNTVAIEITNDHGYPLGKVELDRAQIKTLVNGLTDDFLKPGPQPTARPKCEKCGLAIRENHFEKTETGEAHLNSCPVPRFS